MSNVNLPAAYLDGRQQLARRAAESMLRSLGPTQVSLRIAEPASGDTSSQIGLTTPTVADVPLAPAVVRNVSSGHEVRARYEIVLGNSSVQRAVTTYNITDVATWLLTALGLVYGEKLLHIDTVMVDHFAGSEYLYRVLASE